MCGRAYKTYTDEELYIRYLNTRLRRNPLGKPNYNFCPTQLSPIVVAGDGVRQIREMRWGLVPFWAKDVKSASKYSLINARSEEVFEKRSYQVAILKRRCILPLSGFFEWKRPDDAPKVPYAIYLKDEPIMSVAAIWERWESPDDGEVIESFSLMTTGSNFFMEKIHDRMPVILPKSKEDDWLDPENVKEKNIAPLLRACQSRLLAAHPVSALVNSPKNNSPNLLARA